RWRLLSAAANAPQHVASSRYKGLPMSAAVAGDAVTSGKTEGKACCCACTKIFARQEFFK
ncbi:MAG TPA: hypothetical protein VEY92_08125, partial [Pseudoxanthomonas sp.]|nr:hypothetical protein [Pseudoxanthomonas sp.]